MIPKIIHYCWLSGDPFPPEIQQCIDTWKEQLPDYEVWLWDTNRFDVNAVKWTQQAFEKRKYAFAADYIRLFALYHYGGIYLDSDVIVYKSFNDLLRLPYFIGHDQIRGFEAAIIGAESGCKWIKDLLDSYEGLEFVRSDGSLDILELPCRFHHVLTGLGYKFYRLHQLSDYVMTEKRLEVFDGDFFNSRNAIEVRKTKKSYCAHNYAGSWQNKKASERSIKDILPKWLLKIIYDVGQKTWARNKYAWFQIPFENK